MSKDPIGLKGGINLQAYAPNPVGWVDPKGLETSWWEYLKISYISAWNNTNFDSIFEGISNSANAFPAIGAINTIKTAVNAEKAGAAIVTFGGRVAGETQHSVYIAYRDGKAIYVGITNDMARRMCEHGKRFDRLSALVTNLTRDQARAVEQSIINVSPDFRNAINSIAPSRNWYGEAVEWGNNIAKDLKW